ncbi:hypothetical protein [Acidovorax radicis]|uniref:hypothetical protein n=1 Tax=Acidovorax radicis TaxID=758826 RepID=UPI001CF85826|nr:hypothetical protein [Acidovorax radicis]UCU98226.1 hypothetical protein KI609_17120 [Acidovorax radicis]
MDTEQVPCSMAVDDVCEKLQAPDAAGWLYMVSDGKLARLLTSSDDFAWHPIIIGRESNPDPKDCGLAGALSHMRDLWGDSASPSECNYFAANCLDPLAIRMDKAHELWGWGSVAAPAAVVLSLVQDPTLTPVLSAAPAKRLAQKDIAPEWDGQRLAELRTKFNGEIAPMQLMAEKTGLPDREIRRRVKQWRDSQGNPISANAFAVVKR